MGDRRAAVPSLNAPTLLCSSFLAKPRENGLAQDKLITAGGLARYGRPNPPMEGGVSSGRALPARDEEA